MCRDLILICCVRIPNFITSINRLKHFVEQYFRILSSSFPISSYVLGRTALKPEIKAKIVKFRAFRRIHHLGSDNGCHWRLHTALWNVRWIINEPCGQPWSLYIVIHFLTSLLKVLTSHSVKVLKLCQLISSWIIVVIITMSTCQSIKVTHVKTSNSALLP